MSYKNPQKNSSPSECYGKWVALTMDRKTILGASDDLKQLSQKFGTKEVIYTKPLNPNKSYAF